MHGFRRVRYALMTGIVLSLISACGNRNEDTSNATNQASNESESPQEATPTQPEAHDSASLRRSVTSLFQALSAPSDQIDPQKRDLGRRLFHDTRLSGDNTISCATCHSLEHGGAEPRRVSVGIRNQVGPINSPTVLNAVYNFRQFWDGRAADLLEQAAGPVTNPGEMGGNWDEILVRLRADEGYVSEFGAAYGENAITQANVLDAIVQYESALVTPSRFDRWLAGDDDALSEQERRGLASFRSTGCVACHRGRNIGGDSYQLMGAAHNYFERRGGELTEADMGRFNLTQNESHRHQFKVPTLRNVAHTDPYFHDGSETSLDGAVRTMAYVQLGQELDDETVNNIVAFLQSLSGDLPEYARIPTPTNEVAPTGSTESAGKR